MPEQAAVHETLAEMARLEREVGPIDQIAKDGSIAPEWKRLYSAVNHAWAWRGRQPTDQEIKKAFAEVERIT